MTTRTAAVRNLLDRAVSEIGEPGWTIVGENRLRAKLTASADGIILALAAGFVDFTVSISVGPRFPSIERIVAKAGRAAGLPEAHFRTASAFPTVFARLSDISPLRDNVSLQDVDDIVAALCSHAVPFIRRISTIGAAADYALAHPAAFGHHAMRIPILLTQAGRKIEANEYFERVTESDGLYTDFLRRYRQAVGKEI